MPNIPGTRIDSEGATIASLASMSPRSDDILRIKFSGLTQADVTEIIDTAGYHSASVLVSAVGSNPAAPTDILPFFEAIKGGGSRGQLTENTSRAIYATVNANGTWTAGYLVGLLPRFLSFSFTTAMTIDLVVELRKMRVNIGAASAG